MSDGVKQLALDVFALMLKEGRSLMRPTIAKLLGVPDDARLVGALHILKSNDAVKRREYRRGVVWSVVKLRREPRRPRSEDKPSFIDPTLPPKSKWVVRPHRGAVARGSYRLKTRRRA